MKSILTLIAIFTLFLPLVSFAGHLAGEPGLENTELAIYRSDNRAIEMEFRFEGIAYQKVDHGVGQYDLLNIEHEGKSGVIGAPEVPLITRLFSIPDQAKVKIVSVEPLYKIYQGVHPYPHQEYEYGHKDNNPDWAASDIYYRGNEIFPEKWLELGEPAILRDYRVIPVTVSPIRVNATSGEAMILTSLKVELEFENGGIVNTKTHHFNKTVPSFNKIYSNLIANYDWVNPNGVEVMGSILIIYPNVGGVLNILQPYIEWKTRKGYNTIVDEVTNGTSTTVIQNHINEAYANADPPLEHVILVGDAGGTINIPCNYWTSGWYNGASDHHYTQLEGGDILADITIGRLSVGNTTELQTAINKILYYESEPTLLSTSWYKKGAVVAGSSSSGLSTIQVNQNIRAWMMESGFTQVDTMWYNMGSSIPSFMTNQCNSGITALNFRGYAGVSGFSTSDVYNLNNAFRIPFAVIITCGTGDFGGSGADMSESWLRAGSPSQPTGGIAGVGTATLGTHTRFNNTVDGGLWYGLFDEGLTLLGESLFRGKLELFNAYQNDWGGMQNFTYWNNLMGDPTTDLWTDIPQVTEISHPAEIAVGTSSFTVTVEDSMGNPLADRYVCLWKGEETYIGGRTDESGVYTAPINIATAGTMKVTVTYHNDYPYIADVNVVAEDVYVSFNDLTIIDDGSGSSSGNGDGNANPSEILDLEIEIKNFGNSVSASGIDATLSTDDPNVTILQNSVAYTNLSPGAVSTGYDEFTVQMNPEFPHNYTVQFELLIETGQGNFVSAFDYNVISGENVIAGITYEGGTLNPGDTDDVILTIRNVGGLDLTGVSGTISANDNQITIIDNSGTFGNISVLEQVSNDSDPFIISVDEYATNGRIVNLTLHLESNSGCDQTMNVPVEIGTVSNSDPQGPDDYGYYCIDNTDNEYSGRPSYEWIEIDPAYGGSGTELYLPDYSSEQDVSIKFGIPFTFTYYGEDFDTITVCSNGWIGMGNLANFDDFRNYPIPSAFGPVGGMIAPYWDDLVMGGGGVFVYDDAAEHRIIVEWSRVDHVYYGTQVHTFQVILNDPAYYPTPTGDGEIIFQYHTVNIVSGSGSDNAYFTTGIEDIGHDTGLEYVYWQNYNPASAPVENDRAIKYTTEEPVRSPLVPSLELTMTPVSPPIIIPQSGGPFDFDVSVTNVGTTLNVFDYWVIVTLPNGSEYGPVLLKEGLDLSPGQSISRQLTQNVPGNAPTGDYTYTGYVGDYHDEEIWDEAGFGFSKSGSALSIPGEWTVYGWDENQSSVTEILPQDYKLFPASPNPFNPSTEIRFALPQSGNVKLTVFNSLGRMVAVLTDGWMPAGWHDVKFQADNLSSGLYFYNLQVNDYSSTLKMLLIK